MKAILYGAAAGVAVVGCLLAFTGVGLPLACLLGGVAAGLVYRAEQDHEDGRTSSVWDYITDAAVGAFCFLTVLELATVAAPALMYYGVPGGAAMWNFLNSGGGQALENEVAAAASRPVSRPVPMPEPVPVTEPAVPASETEASVVADSQAAYQKAADTHQQLVNDLGPSYDRKTVFSNNSKTLSGWTGKTTSIPDGYGLSRVEPDEVQAAGQKVGYTFPDAKPSFRDGGVPGQGTACHGEAQGLTYETNNLNPGESYPGMGVSKTMCPSCQNYFSQTAQSQNQPLYITDPNGTWRYNTEGTRTLMQSGGN